MKKSTPTSLPLYSVLPMAKSTVKLTAKQKHGKDKFAIQTKKKG